MDLTGRRVWIRGVTLAGVLYFIIGYGSAIVDPYLPDRFRFSWRLSSWIASAVVFAAHIAYEFFRQHNSPRSTAVHTAVAVGIGGLLIAAAATIRATTVESHVPFSRYLIALVVWPLITGVPAFVVALTVTTLLSYLQTKRLARSRT